MCVCLCVCVCVHVCVCVSVCSLAEPDPTYYKGRVSPTDSITFVLKTTGSRVGDKELVAISSECYKTEPCGIVDLAMSVFCSLWNDDISQGSMKTKRKRLSGASAKKAVGVLDELSAASYGKISLIFDEH